LIKLIKELIKIILLN